MSKYYILEGRKAVQADLMTWAKAFESQDRKVAKTAIGDYLVSTVFVGINHQYGEGPPLFFETMVFGEGLFSEQQTRCTTWEEAEAMHEAMCALVRSNALSRSNPLRIAVQPGV
jgi:hypothetical protein